MLVVLLLLVPLVGGLFSFFLRDKNAITFALANSVATCCIAIWSYMQYTSTVAFENLSHNISWIPNIGARFHIGLVNGDGMAMLMVLLSAIAFPLIFLSLWNKVPEKAGRFFGLMLLAEVGLLGVFLAKDALLFYIFWELALIPVYFLSSLYGGPKRIAVSFKFFVYTFVGSLIMLIGILLIYRQVPIPSFDWDAFVSVGRSMPLSEQLWLFWMLFIAFAIKMPIFPLHTWQPDAYEQSHSAVTIVLSAIMVKMGLFAVVRWLLPIVPLGSHHFMNVVMLLSILGIIYASCLALVQTNIKRMIAYSSIAHIGLMCAAIFSFDLLGTQGAVIQMFNHGITIMGLWIVVSILEHRLQTQDMRQMGGIAKVAPAFTIALVLFSLANIALPLTNGFIGEFMMFNGLFKSASIYRIPFTLFAGLGIILAAVYTLGMIQKVAYGNLLSNTQGFTDLSWNERIAIGIISLIIVILGFYPKLLMDLVFLEPVFKP